MTPDLFETNIGRGHALRRAARSLLLNQIMMKLIASRDFKSQPQLAIFSHDLIGQAINVHGWWEHDELLLLRAFLDRRVGRGGAMLDIGANIGNHTVFLREWFDEIHAVEANPRTFRLLRFNVDPYSHITAHNFAASDQDGYLDFVVDFQNVGASHVAGDADAEVSNERHSQVVARRLEDALDPSAPVRLIKIDVEGHELRCLRGARRLIDRDRPFIVFEQLPREFSQGTSPVIEELRERGYRQFHVLMRRPSLSRTGALRQLASAFWAMAFGFRMAAVPTVSFKPAHYEMIIASP
jgi:FkbM family methyltransferase